MALCATFWRRTAGRRLAYCLAAGTLAASAWGGETGENVVAPPRADAGADRSAEVGDRVTLDGAASPPVAGLSYRWIPAGGPPVRLKLEDRHVITWVPELPGLYRFALVVAGGGGISEPDYVEIMVADSPKKTTSDRAASTAANRALQALDASGSTAGALAEIADRIAARVELYDSYNVLLHELSRSLDALLPPDAATRGRWNEQLFVPLSALLAERMRAASLDLSRPGSLDSTLTASQKSLLAAFFGELAAGARGYRDALR